MNLIIYHRDLDGLASALIAGKKYDADLCSIMHGEEKEFYSSYEDTEWDTIILVDFSFKDMLVTFKEHNITFNDFIWIDHHKTIEYVPYKEIEGIRDTEKAACQLTWDYFFPNCKIPYGIQLIADMDMWKFKYRTDTHDFIEYLQLYDISEVQIISNIIFEPKTKIKDYIETGSIFVTHRDAIIKKLYKNGCIVDFKGYKCYTCNTTIYTSFLSEYVFNLFKDKVDIVRTIQYKYNNYKLIKINNLYSRKEIDVSQIAKQLGGGGHYHAAGYTEEI